MSKKNWIKRISFTILFFISIALSFNYIINPYGVFEIKNIDGINAVKNYSISSEMSKFHYALRQDPKTIMLGSSRVEHINPKYLEKYVQNKVYNLGVKGSGITSQYYLLKYFVEEKQVKTVILGLDFYAFSPINVNTGKIPLRYMGNYTDDYLDSLLSIRTFRKSINTLKDNLKEKDFKVNQNTGWESYSEDYKVLDNEGNIWLKNRINSAFPNFGNDKHFFGSSEFKKKESIKKGLEVLDKIILLCKKNNVDLKIFTSPVYHKIYDVIEREGYLNTYNYWKKELSKYNMIYDFNYKNTITKDYRNYIDGSHYKSELGKLIFAKLYNDEINDLPKDFGKILLKINEKE